MSAPMKQTSNKKTIVKRPKKLLTVVESNYPFGKNILPECDYNPEAMTYVFTHNLGPNPSNKWYGGMHGFKEHESPYDGTYWNSSTDEEFKELLETKPEEFTYEILKFGSMQNMFNAENAYLTKRNPEGALKNPMSWNKTNGILFQTEEPPRLDIIEDLVKDVYSKKNPNLKNVKISDILLQQLIKLQVRFETTLSSGKIKEYKDRMIAESSTKSFTLTIVVNDGKWLLAGGNHTLESATQAKMKNIDVVFIYEELSIDELYALGSALNRQDKVDRMKTEISTIARDLVSLYKSGKISDGTFKSKYCTAYMKVTGNLVGSQLNACRKEAILMIKEKASWKPGKKWKDWKLTKAVKAAETLCRSLTNDNTLVTHYSGTMFDPNRVAAKWYEDSLVRIENGFKPRNNITVYLHWNKMMSFTEWSKSDEWDKNEEAIMIYMYGFIHMKTKIDPLKFFPNVKYKKLEQWEDDTTSIA
jgi:hypothetical protein